jgi:hypothetical protein
MSALGISIALMDKGLKWETHRDCRRQVLQRLVDWKVQFRVEEATAALNSVGEIEHRVGIL